MHCVQEHDRLVPHQCLKAVSTGFCDFFAFINSALAAAAMCSERTITGSRHIEAVQTECQLTSISVGTPSCSSPPATYTHDFPFDKRTDDLSVQLLQQYAASAAKCRTGSIFNYLDFGSFLGRPAS
eukprot:9032-Heterococcus_DN1.PRE.3